MSVVYVDFVNKERVEVSEKVMGYMDNYYDKEELREYILDAQRAKFFMKVQEVFGR
jgi:hypothetical protein